MGELPKYYVRDAHPAIIDWDTFQRVQEEIARRSGLRKTSSTTKTELGKYCGKYVLSELLVCGECGSPYRRAIWSRPEGKRAVWRCINRLEHGKRSANETDVHVAVTATFDRRMERIARELEQAGGTIAEFDEVTVCQLVSNIKVVSKDTLMVCFKDGTEVMQTI